MPGLDPGIHRAARAIDGRVKPGHDDSKHRKLAHARAEAVVRFLVDGGVDAARVEIDSRGEAEPLMPTGDEVPEVQNRRVEIRFEPIPNPEGVPVASLATGGRATR